MNGPLQQSNIIWPVAFEEEKVDDTILRSDRGRKWMKRLELRKTMRENASFVLNPTQYLPSVPSRTKRENHKMTYDTRRIANKMLREKMCKQIVTPLGFSSSESVGTPPPERILKRRRRRRKKKKKSVPPLTPLEQASKRLDEIFMIKSTASISPSKPSSKKPGTVTKYRVMASRMENVWSTSKPLHP